MLQVGDKIPSFHSMDMDGKPFTEKKLEGKVSVIYFYPKDETPGCTKEACSFRDGMDEIKNLGALVIGISPDSINSHQKFSKNHSLNFTLLSDENKEVCKKFGVLRKKETPKGEVISLERTTFIIGKDGIVKWIERPVSVEDHTTRVMSVIEEIIKND